MNSLKICDAVNWQIELAGINSEDAITIKTCVSRYTPYDESDKVSEKVKYLFNRICNAIKSVFGESDWQRAERALAKNIYSYVPSPCRNFAQRNTQTQINYLAGRTLKFLVWENKNQLSVPSTLKPMIQTQLVLAKFVVASYALNLFQKTLNSNLGVMGPVAEEMIRSLYQTPTNYSQTPVRGGNHAVTSRGTQRSVNRLSNNTQHTLSPSGSPLFPLIANIATNLFSPNSSRQRY